MKLSWKLLICNIVFCLVVGVVALTGLLYIVKLDDSGYDISYVELTEIREIFNEIRVGGLSDSESVELAGEKLNDKGYNYFFFDRDGNLVSTNSSESIEKKLAEKYQSPQDGQAVIIEKGVFLTSQVLPSGSIVCVDSTRSTAIKQHKYYYIYLGSIILASIGMIVAIAMSEYLIVMPRMKALSQAMKEVFRGNYERVIEVESKGKDELSVLLAEFDMLRKKLADQEKEKEAFDRERGIMISGISHDLRTPLSVIQGYSKGIKDGIARRIGKEEEYIEKIYSTALSMNELIDKLSAFAKMQSREVMYTFQEYDLCEIVNDFIHKNYVQYSARGIEINGIVPQGKRLLVYIDKVQFDRIFQNICDNSLKYKEKATAKMTIKVVDAGENAEIYLSDDGPGVKDFEAEYIFESYYRGDPSRTNPVSGSGLGLSIVKNVVHAHKGEVSAYNDNGLTIKITIPIRRKR